jgi:aminoglycoside phosphotransferase (APT) family kinase protein
VDRVVDTLNATMPRQTEAAIVHGDFKLANVIYRKDLSTIAAVIDWEMATLGDPLTDLALLAMYQQLGFAGACGMPRITAEAGFLDGLQLLERYAGRSHRDLGDIAWYLGFAYFKFAVVVEGIHNRYLQGKTLGEGFDNLGAEAPILLNTALDALPHR